MRSLSACKKGNSGNALLAWIIIFGLIGLVGSIFGLIQSSVEDEIVTEVGADSWAYNNSQDAQEAQGKIFGKLGLVATVVILSLVLMLVLGIVAYFNNRNSGVMG